MAKLVGCSVGKLVLVGGDTHIYNNHVDQCEQLVSRTPLPLPELILPDFNDLAGCLEHSVESFKLDNYQHHGAILAPMAV